MSSSNSLIVILVARATKLYQCANSPQHQARNRSAKLGGPQAARRRGGGAAEVRRPSGVCRLQGPGSSAGCRPAACGLPTVGCSVSASDRQWTVHLAKRSRGGGGGGAELGEQARARAARPSRPGAVGRRTRCWTAACWWRLAAAALEPGRTVSGRLAAGHQRVTSASVPLPPWWAGRLGRWGLGWSLVGWALGYAAAHLDHPIAPPLPFGPAHFLLILLSL
jgi:hypothetical protein